MNRFNASSVGINADVDHGEGGLTFVWPDELQGHDVLTIDLDGHCSRRMPIHSGTGLPEIVELFRDKIVMRFTPELAGKLMLSELIEIRFVLTDEEYSKLRTIVGVFNG